MNRPTAMTRGAPGTRQSGAGLLGTLVTVAAIGVLVFMGIRLVPMYMDNLSVRSALRALDEDVRPGAPPGEIRGALLKRLQLNRIGDIRAEDIEVRATGRTRVVTVAYEARTRLYGNLDLVMRFDESTVLADR